MAQKIRLSIKGSTFVPDKISVVEYFSKHGYRIYYSYDEVFKFLEDRGNFFGKKFDYVESKKGYYKAAFLKNYLDNVVNNFQNVFPIKLLIDSFLYQPIRTVFCFSGGTDGIFEISKGTKKLIAFDFLSLTHSHVLITSKELLSNPIKSDEELYWLLRKIDPISHNFNIIIDNLDLNPRIHYIESVDTIGKWSSMETLHQEIFKYTMPPIPARIKFTGLSYTTDERIIACEDDYYCSVYSSKLTNVSLDYLYLCSSNMFYKQKVKVGTTLDNSLRIEYNWPNFNPSGQADFFIPNL